VRAALILATIVPPLLAGGCGLVRDMRSEYVANRAVGSAISQLAGPAPRKDVALAELDLAYRLRSHDERFVARLAGPYLAAGDHERALACYEVSTKVTGAPHDLQLGMCHLELGDTERALKRLDAAVEKAIADHQSDSITSQEYAWVLNDVGYVLADARLRPDDAFRMIKEAVRIAPTAPEYIDSLGWAYYRRGEDLQAAFYLERAARLAGRQDPEMLWHLGAVHARLRQFRRAESELVRALELDPANDEARQTLNRLQRELPPPAEV